MYRETRSCEAVLFDAGILVSVHREALLSV
jgi:hypothetical protein